jgi:peptidyl-Asp metalloendopeptidase
MRKLALTLTAALIVGGCSSESEVAQKTAQASTNSKDITSLAQAPILSTDRKSTFATMPDHGTLLAYDRSQQPLHRGAQTYHAVQLSEAHAMNAAAPGKSIELPMPSGGTVRIDYLRHEEGLDGNWSWVGKTADGLDAVITFGESAVFGRIAQRDTEALRLTMSAGRSWLVESDPSKMLDGNLGRDPDESDVLIPHNVVAAVIAKKRSAAAMTAAADEAAGPAETVDVVLGFTSGLVTKYGSAANANTRLANLVAITNQGYVNSLVTPRIRLVRTLEVSYIDTNSNDTALEALTGYTCSTTGCTAQTVPTELVPLRTARDTYGGDLVSLVRPFQAPQHQGCGIAWLLGGGGFTIDNTDAPFGYSVISDGTDVDEGDGRTYFCREETLSHELGHNMGQQHNIEDAGVPPDTGTHSYSYGYREATTTGFYTVMAYRLPNSSQFSINYFGNPSVNYADTGRPTGTATADNARSLNLSMPLVVQFRNAVVPFPGKARNDFNGDGRSEIYWRNSSTGANAIWVLNGSSVTSATTVHIEADQAWKVLGFGDFNADGRSDVFWRNATTGQNFIHMMNGNVAIGASFSRTESDLTWNPIAFGDFDGDGDGDIYWRNSVTGACVIWYMQGFMPVTIRFVHTEPSASWVIIGASDFNGDGISDILWRNSVSGFVYMHIMSNTGVNGAASGGVGTVSDLSWQIAAIDDFNGDGKGDIYWRNQTSGANYLWALNGLNLVLGQGLNTEPDLNWKIAATGDFNGDGRSDVFWRHATNGSNHVHLMNGPAFLPGSGPTLAQPSLSWQVVSSSAFGGG